MKFISLAKKLIGYGAGCGYVQHLLRNKIVVFMFHRVVDDGYYRNCTFQQSTMITANGFRKFLQFAEEHFTIITLSTLLKGKYLSHSGDGKPRAIITFDDGWRDNYELAFPILRSRGLPAAIFLTTDYIDSDLGFWWQGIGELLTATDLTLSCREHIKKFLPRTLPASDFPCDIFGQCDSFIEILKQKHFSEADRIARVCHELAEKKIVNPCLSWEQCEHMSAHGIEFGSHTLSHPRLSLLDDESLDRELRLSKRILHENRINSIDAICYPYGDYDKRTLKSAGKYYTIGLTTNASIFSDFATNNMTLPRINIPEAIISSRNMLYYRLTKAAMKWDQEQKYGH